MLKPRDKPAKTVDSNQSFFERQGIDDSRSMAGGKNDWNNLTGG
jgi:hypothetical protein